MDLNGDARIHFDDFEFDPRSGQLLRNGQPIRIQPQPLRVLKLLLERPGQTISREKLRDHIWGGATYVEFDQGLNYCIRQIRLALRDNAASPTYVETLPKQGYRFIADVRENDSLLKAELADAAPEPPAFPVRSLASSKSTLLATASPPHSPLSGKTARYGALIAAGIALTLAVLLIPAPPAGALDSRQITFSPEPKDGPLFTDGTRLYFSSNGEASQMAVTGGTIATMRVLQPGMQLLDLSPDGSQMLALKPEANNEINLGSLWLVPTVGGTPRRLGSNLALAARWSPDGRSLAFTNQRKLYIGGPDGANAKEIWMGPAYLTDLCFSPDSRRIAVTAFAESANFSRIWTLRADGGDAHPLRLDWPENGNQNSPQWTPDGRHFLFMSDVEGRSNVYEMVAPRWYKFWHQASPVRLTGNQLDIQGAVPARDGSALFVVGRLQQGVMHYLDLQTKKYNSFLQGLPAIEFTVSPDRKWIAYIEYPTGYLWKCRLDGSDKVQLTHSYAGMQQWSPDSKSLVFSDWSKLYVISADGGVPERLSGRNESGGEVGPSWSPDGQSIYFNDYPYPDQPFKGIQILDLRTRKISLMPGAQSLYAPLWSPDGKFLVAIGQNPPRLMLYSVNAKTWSELKRFDAAWGWDAWANDSKSLYVSLTQGENGLYTLTVPKGAWKKLSDLERIDSYNPLRGYISVTPDGQPAMMIDTSISQIYSLRFR